MKYFSKRNLVLLVGVSGISLAAYIIIAYTLLFLHNQSKREAIIFLAFLLSFNLVMYLYFEEEYKKHKNDRNS